MKQVHKLIQLYKEDAAHYDDFDDDEIKEVLDGLDESLSSLKESNANSYTQTINEYRNSLQTNSEKEIINDFIKYCKYYK
jgi:hypothetical protein